MNHVLLMKDLERLDDLLVLARNILTAHKCAQDFAGETGLDKQVFKLIGLCIRVTAQGYDGDPASRNETIWANIVQLCKYIVWRFSRDGGIELSYIRLARDRHISLIDGFDR